MKKYFLLVLFFHLLQTTGLCQRTVSITIDDVPNTSKYEKDHFESKLLDLLDSLKIPVAIFINEGLIYKTEEVTRNFSLLNDWAKNDLVTLGNHSFNHPAYSEVGIDSFKIEIEKGESITNELAKVYKKTLHHFRFPFNNLGKDSLQHIQVEQFLKSKGYSITPYTVESSDWMFNYLYEHYLKEKQFDNAERIGKEYLRQTMVNFQYFDSLAIKQYERTVHQIYLCHDNSINADYLPSLIQQLEVQQYSFISLDKALEDPIYHQTDSYHKKWGVSWFYRWMKNPKERMKLMRQEPEFKNIIKEYERVVAQNKK
ncbi:MAG: polysaccharide deacetylase family protein [Saprospiraceae bacterium]